MKRIYILTVSMVLLFYTHTFAEKWELIDGEYSVVNKNNGIQTLELFDMEELNGVYYANNYNGQKCLVKSSDKGMTWDSCFYLPDDTIGQNYFLYDIVKQENSLFVPSDIGRIYNSFDGGETWSYTYLGDEDKHAIKHLKFVNDSVGFVGHILGSVFSKTTDGGHTWNPLPDATDQLPEVFGLYDFIPVDENTIYFVGGWGDDYYTYKTTNEGEVWEKIETDKHYYSNLSYHNNYFYATNGIKLDTKGYNELYRTKDFVEWESSFVTDTIGGIQSIRELKFLDGIAIGLGGDIFLVSTDGGESWVDLYDENDSFYSHQNISVGFIYYDGYVYAQGKRKEKNEEGDDVFRNKMYRYKLDLNSTVKEYNINISLYPNPTNSILNIESEESISSIKIIDLNGNILNQIKYNGIQNEVNIDVEDLQHGIYFIKINDKIYKRFVKE